MTHHDQWATARNCLSILFVGLALGAFMLTGCDSAGTTGEGNVEVGFRTGSSTPKNAQSSQNAPSSQSTESLVINGSNGELVIQDIRLIVSELELEGEAENAEFEADPSFLDLPLNTSEIAPVTSSRLPAGTYTELEFEVEDFDFGEAEDEEEAEEDLRALLETIREDFPDWPDKASMVAVGTFTPASGDMTRSFTTYFEAEIEVEREFNEPLKVTSNGPSRSVTVTIDPTQWFENADGTAWNLADYDYESTGELVEFEAEFENGVTEIESDEDDGDDDDDDGDDDGDDD